MSRSGYTEDEDYDGQFAMWRGQVASAIRGKRGQAFLREMVDALEAMPEKRLIRNELRTHDGEVCAIGSVGARRGVDMEHLDPEDPHQIANTFGIAHQLVSEIEWINDEHGNSDTPERRWERVHQWALSYLAKPESA